MRPIFFLREALRALKRNAIPSFAAMATVLVTVLVLGVFLPVVQATTGAANEVRGKVIADVYLKSDVKQRDIDRVGRLLKEEPLIGKVEFISKEQAYKTEKERNPKAYELLGSNPLPDTYRVTPRNPDDIAKIKDALAPAAAGDAGVSGFTQMLWWHWLVIAIVLAAAETFLPGAVAIWFAASAEVAANEFCASRALPRIEAAVSAPTALSVRSTSIASDLT